MTQDSQPQQTTEAAPSTLDRRKFLKRAAIGAGALGTIALVPALVKDSGASPETMAAIDEMPAGEPVMLYVRDAARGEAVIMSGDSERVVMDRVLVARLLQAQRRTDA